MGGECAPEVAAFARFQCGQRVLVREVTELALARQTLRVVEEDGCTAVAVEDPNDPSDVSTICGCVNSAKSSRATTVGWRGGAESDGARHVFLVSKGGMERAQVRAMPM